MNKLTYTQCKELKDAGFPQEENGNSFYCNEELCGRNYDDCDQEFVIIPTLESLIEECGGKLHILSHDVHNLEKEDEKWFAGDDDCGDNCPKLRDMFGVHGVGKTPIEAVSRLWLALNKK